MNILMTVIGKERVVAAITGMSDRLRRAIMRTVARLTLGVQRQVVVHHLSGPTGPNSLSVGTRPGEPHGKLRRSVQVSLPASVENIEGRVFYTGDVPYAAIHEFGGHINVPEIIPSKAKVLAFMSKGGDQVFTRRTRPHTVVMPERAPLRTGFGEMIPTIQDELADTVANEAVLK